VEEGADDLGELQNLVQNSQQTNKKGQIFLARFSNPPQLPPSTTLPVTESNSLETTLPFSDELRHLV